MIDRCSYPGLSVTYISQMLLKCFNEKLVVDLEDSLGLVDGDFINRVYERVFHKMPDVKSLNQYLTELQNGRFSKQALIYIIYNSDENIKKNIKIKHVDEYELEYKKELAAPDNYNNGLSKELCSLSNDDFISRIYDDLLDREADEVGKKALVAALNNGMPKEEAVWIICSSGEYQQNKRARIKIKYYELWNKLNERVNSRGNLNDKLSYLVFRHFGKYFM